MFIFCALPWADLLKVYYLDVLTILFLYLAEMSVTQNLDYILDQGAHLLAMN